MNIIIQGGSAEPHKPPWFSYNRRPNIIFSGWAVTPIIVFRRQGLKCGEIESRECIRDGTLLAPCV